MADPTTPSTAAPRGPHLPALDRLTPVPPLPGWAARSRPARARATSSWSSIAGAAGSPARPRPAPPRLRHRDDGADPPRRGVALRPPDLRHLDAAVSAIAVDAQALEGSLRHQLEASMPRAARRAAARSSSRSSSGTSEASDPSRRSFRCAALPLGRADGRHVRWTAMTSTSRARSMPIRGPTGPARARFRTPRDGHPLPGELVALFPPRAQLALVADPRSIEAEMPVPGGPVSPAPGGGRTWPEPISRLNGYPGRIAQHPDRAGQRAAARPRAIGANATPGRPSRRARGVVRAFVQASIAGQRTPARVGPDLRSLVDGSANVALRFGMPVGRETFGPPPRPGGQPGARPRVSPAIRLVLSQPPIHWSAEHLAFAYLASPWPSVRKLPPRCRCRASSGSPPRSRLGA